MASSTQQNQKNSKYGTSKPNMATTRSLSVAHDECPNIKDCQSLNQIKDILVFYQNMKDPNNHIDDTQMVQKLDQCKNLINDYHHVLLHHLTTGNKIIDNKNFGVIHAVIHDSIQCDISECINYKRNHRNRHKQQQTDADINQDTLLNESIHLEHSGDDTAVFYKEFLDSIHCYFVHSVDVGFRMQIHANMDENKHEAELCMDDLDTESIELYKDKQIEKCKEMWKIQRHKLQKIRGVNRVQFNKFSTDISDVSLEKQQMEVPKSTSNDRKEDENNTDDNKSDNDEKHSEIHKSEVTVYSFGYKYYYWEIFKDMEWFIPKKYADLEEEMLQLLDKESYSRTMTKAKKMLCGDELRKLKSHEWKNYGIDKGLSIDLSHIMAICLYTDFDELSFQFSQSLRKIASDESNENIKKRNMEYREWSRILRETVECYGTTISDTKLKVFYHGISLVYFDSFIAKFCCPTSTTTQLEVAAIFADTNGIILELEKSSIGGSLRYFNCSLLSVYGSEDERLFIGGKQPLQFRSIRMVSQNHNYKYFVKALSLFDKIINSQRLYEDEISCVTKTDYKVVDALIKHEIGEKKNKFPQYINTCFKTFARNKKVVKFNLAYMKDQYPLFCEAFLDKSFSHYFLDNMDNNLLAFDYIANIFKEAEEIHSIRTDPAQDAFTGQGFMYLDALVAILAKISKNDAIKLKLIRIYGKKDLAENESYSNFKTYMLDKTGWHLKISNNQLIIARTLSANT